MLKRGIVIKFGRIMLKVKNYKIENALNPEDQKECPCEATPIDMQASKCIPK